MNFEYFLYQYLLNHHKAEIPDFGIFELTKQSAKIDAENALILPPKESIRFEYNSAVHSSDFAKYVAEETNSNLFVVQMDLKAKVSEWRNKLNSENHLALSNIGQFRLDGENNIVKISDDADAFGFEEVNLNHLKTKKKSIKSSNEDYTFNKNIIWTFVSLIIIGSAALFLFGDKELIFGKSSQISTKESSIKNKPLKVSEKLKQDSIKTDSLKTATNAEVQNSKK